MMLTIRGRMLQMKKMTTTTSSITARLCSFFSWLESIDLVAFALRISRKINRFNAAKETKGTMYMKTRYM